MVRGQCVELLRTRYVHQFERCPVLAIAVTQEIKFPEPKGLEWPCARPLSVQRRNIPVGLTAWRACAAAMHSLPLKRATIRLKAAIAKQITPTRPRPLGKLEASNIAGPGKRDWHGGLALGSGASMLENTYARDIISILV
jgi:hypothetical protein